MSRRQLRKLEALKAEKASEDIARDEPLSESVDGSGDNENFDQPVARNRFDMLLEDSDNEGDADSEYSEQQSGLERSGGNCAAQAISTQSASHLKVKKKKRKKKKKPQASSADKTDASEDLELDEVEASVREVNELLGETELADSETAASVSGPSMSPREHLLSVEYRYMDAKQELQRIFGNEVVVTERSRVRHQGRGVGRIKMSSKASLTGGYQHFLPHDNGISMVPDPEHRFNNRGKMAVYRYVHDNKYQMHQLRFDHALEARDQEGILELMHIKPHHIDTLLQLSGMFRSQDDFTYADELVQKAIMELEFSMLGCRLTEPTCSLDFKRMENRGLFYALFYQMQSVARRQCFRSALELSKILLRLSADGDDPLAVILLIDFYAVRSQEYVWLLEYFRSYNEKQNLLMLPNFAFSVPLAYFFLSEQPGSCIAHKSLKQRLQNAQTEHYKGKKSMRATADTLLQQALIAFPEVFVKLMETNGVELKKEIVFSNHFAISRWHTHPLHALCQLYAMRMAPLWKQPEVLDWLTENACSALKLIEEGAPSVAQSKKLRMAPNISLPVPVMRHLIITQFPDVGEYVPIGVLLKSHDRYHDVIPPAGSHRSYEKVYLSRDGRPTHRPPPAQTAPQRGIIAEFFATLWPDNFTYQEPAELHLAERAPRAEMAAAPAPAPAPAPAAAPAPAPAPAVAATLDGAVGAEAPAGATADASTSASDAALESFLYFLDSARTLLDSTLMRVREGEEAGDEGGESVEWAAAGEESDHAQQEEDFNEDQDQH